ncbi:MAG: hypothetical protein U5K43_12110 [Halofilum sp. (in: g-proteobacteria)]|nr:hypothetical protein [Halofilum sp. (in: g-proteobacteria)]
MVDEVHPDDDRCSRAPCRYGAASCPGWSAAFSYFFCLLCSYYILRPVRDEMGVRGGVENMQWLFTATFFAMLAAVPVFAALAHALSRARA